jgi:ABC-type microcin C transport system permease subunit YejB
MREYFLRRLLLTIPTFLGATLVVFVIIQLAPGDRWSSRLWHCAWRWAGKLPPEGSPGRPGQ